MSVLIKIAFRNVILNRRKSILLGITIFFSSFLLMMAIATMNGVEYQVLRGYLNLQSGHVLVMWNDLKDTNHSDTQRFINIYESLSFNPETNNKNHESVVRFEEYMEKNKKAVDQYFPTIRRNGKLLIDGEMDGAFIVYSLSGEGSQHIMNTQSLVMIDGELLSDDGICISEEKANKHNLRLGDEVKVEVATTTETLVTKTYILTGIYANGAFYDNYYGFVAHKTARELYDIDDKMFDVTRIYLKDMNKASTISNELDKYLMPEQKMLRAESYLDANTFFTTNPRNIRMMVSLFILVLLIIIALGLRSTVRMNLFQRMKEFGTIRAIGFSRLQSYLIIFFEVFFLAAISFSIALTITIIFVLIFGNSGVYVGPAVSSMFGGEKFYPLLKYYDVIFALATIIIFALMSTFNPGMKLCYQKIVDLIDKRQKRNYPIFIMIKSLLGKNK